MTTGSSCGACGFENAADAGFCRSCGASMTTPEPASEMPGAPAAAEPQGLDWGWVVRGVLIIFVAGFGLGFLTGLVLVLMGVTEAAPGLFMLVGVFGFGLGGYIVGRLSPGKTIIEPGVSALIATAITLFLQGGFGVLDVLVGGLLPFGAACLGAWLGEKAQGTI